MDDNKVVDESKLPTPADLAPGQTISPQTENANQPELPSLPPTQTIEQSPEQTLPAQSVSVENIPETEQLEAQEPTEFADELPLENTEQSAAVSWTASEFIAHHKNSGWYGLLILSSITLAVVVFLLTRDWLSAAVVVVAGVVMAGYSLRKPQQQSYEVGPEGLVIGDKFYPYAGFRSFSVVPEGAFASIVFMPLKRFGVQTTIYYDPNDEERILDVITLHLPHEEHRADMLDHVMRRIRF